MKMLTHQCASLLVQLGKTAGAEGTAARRWRGVRSCNLLVSIGDVTLRRRAECDATLAFVRLSDRVALGGTLSARSFTV